MEDVLEVYHRPYDEKRPLVCLDEASKQLIGETVLPLPAEPGQPERFDYEYVRNGTANLFMISEPLLGWRAVQVTERRTAVDFAEVLRWLAEDVHPDAERLVLVVDDLNTHGPWCLYEALPAEQARRIAARLEWHYTPRHGSWPDVVWRWGSSRMSTSIRGPNRRSRTRAMFTSSRGSALPEENSRIELAMYCPTPGRFSTSRRLRGNRPSRATISRTRARRDAAR